MVNEPKTVIPLHNKFIPNHVALSLLKITALTISDNPKNAHNKQNKYVLKLTLTTSFFICKISKQTYAVVNPKLIILNNTNFFK